MPPKARPPRPAPGKCKAGYLANRNRQPGERRCLAQDGLAHCNTRVRDLEMGNAASQVGHARTAALYQESAKNLRAATDKAQVKKQKKRLLKELAANKAKLANKGKLEAKPAKTEIQKKEKQLKKLKQALARMDS
jgi:glutathione S-transferase